MDKFLEIIKQFFDIIQFKYIIIITFIVTGIMIHNPFDLLNTLGIYETINLFAEKYEDMISIIFLTTFIILSIMILLNLINRFKNFFYLLKVLFNSNSTEYSILYELKKGEAPLPIDENATVNLYSHNIIYTNNKIARARVGHSLALNYNLKTWAYIIVCFRI
ncbi:MAG: hypothetical protein PHR25_05500 [Clostridia bacterium]|nr:hypothetical protein [Clostridia bacterium]